jgi:RND family efflux transporter MFP subunit
MKSLLMGITALVAIAAALAGGYYWGSRGTAHPEPAAAAPAPAAGAGRIAYYRNPMGLPDTSSVPKKDPMGMDYVPVYEGEEPQGPGVKIALNRVQKLGVRTEAASRRDLSRAVRAVGTVEIDERGQRTVTARFEGWIQRLQVNTTGQGVQLGQPLMEVYSPDLVAAQQEYIVATRGLARLKDSGPEYQASMQSLVEGSLQRLRNWEIGESELARLREGGQPVNSVTLRSPASGVVIEKPAVQGMRFMPGEVLFKVADLSTVWLVAEVFEQDLGSIRPGQAATVRVNAYPERTFSGRVAFINPSLAGETRTGKVRIELANPGQLLKPAMYANVEFNTARGASRVAVPDSAVLDSGTRQLVLVRRGEGLFEPRTVKLGSRGDGYVEVLDGIKEGEEVVTSANFLIDAESNLRAAVSGFAAPPATLHLAVGTVDELDPKALTASISHGPVKSLGWNSMTMEFKLGNAELLKTLKPGARVKFQFAEGTPGEWVIQSAAPEGTGK